MESRHTSWRRTFLIIYTGQAFSLLGSAAVNFALIWWLTASTGSAGILAYAAIAAFLPQAVVAPFAGPYIDRWDRRLTMIVADLFIAVTSAGLIVLFAAAPAPSTAVVIVFIAVRSVGTAFHAPASQAAVPMYVPQGELTRVAGWNFFLMSGVAMAGPVLGAFLMGVLPIAWVITLDVAGALLACASLVLVRIPHPQRSADDPATVGVFREMAAGWRELVRYRGLLVLTLVLAVAVFVYLPVGALFPLMTLSHFGGGAAQASVVELAFGGGMLVGSLLIGVLGRKIRGGRMTAYGILLLGATLVASGLLPQSGFVAFVIICVAMGLSAPAFSAPVQAMFQSMIEPAKLGRVMSLTTTITVLASPLGLLTAGPLAERLGVAPWFALSGVLLLAVGGFCLVSRDVRGLDARVPVQAVSGAGVRGATSTCHDADECRHVGTTGIEANGGMATRRV